MRPPDVTGGEDVRHADGEISSTIDGDAGSLGQSKPGRDPDANHHEFGIE